MLDEQRDVAATFPQRRNQDRNDVEAEIEVFAEFAALNHFFEVLVRRRDDAHVDLDRACRAEAFDFLLLQDAQHLGLRLCAHVADFVEKDRAAIRLLELADLLFGGARERSFLVAEQLRFDELFGDGGTVHLNEALAGSRAVAMNRPRDELFANAALSQQHHGGIGGSGPLDRFQDRAERLAFADDLVLRLHREPERAVLLAELAHLQPVGHRHQDSLARERLFDEVEGAQTRGVHRVCNGAVSGDHGDRQRLVHLADFGERFEPVHARHLDVEQHEIGPIALDERRARLDRTRRR